MPCTLGVNIDHVATVREARKIDQPSPVEAAKLCEQAGCHGITVHLREDRRHIQDDDVRQLRESVRSKLNLEMSLAPDIVQFSLELGPDMVTLVPEKRQEVTTEGGLDVIQFEGQMGSLCQEFAQKQIPVSLFVDPDHKQLDACARLGVSHVELHTGAYANARQQTELQEQLSLLKEASAYAQSLGLRVNAGHGLNCENVQAIAAIPGMEELNIGHSIIARSIFIGLKAAVSEMLSLIEEASV